MQQAGSILRGQRIDRPLVLLPGGEPLANSAEMLNSPKMAQLVADMKSRYHSRIIIFDLPPVLSSADALAFSPYVDAALLVAADGADSAVRGLLGIGAREKDYGQSAVICNVTPEVPHGGRALIIRAAGIVGLRRERCKRRCTVSPRPAARAGGT